MTQTNTHAVRRTAIAMALLSCCVIGSAAQGAEILQTKLINVSVTGSHSPSTPLPLDVDTAFNGFNQPGGTLTGVELLWDLDLQLAVSAQGCQALKTCDTSPTSGPSIIDWFFRGAGGAFGTTAFDDESWDYNFNNDTNVLQTRSTTLLLNGAASLGTAGFAGPGSIGAVENYSTTQAGRVVYGTRGLSGTVTLKYTYTEAPIPGTLALFGIGLAGFGASRRRQAA
jgi:hypothetical protein